MVLINLVPVDPQNKEHVDFLYEIIQYRWKNHDIVNIVYRTDRITPTYEEHEAALKSSRYKHHYIIRLGDINIGSTYIDNEDTYGMFFLPKDVKKALKTYGKTTELETRPEPMSVVAFKCLIALHPEITLYYATVNPKNTLSRNVMVKGGHEEVEVILTQKTINGKLVGGAWPDVYEDGKPV
jgi:hypothetical protein